MANRNKAYNPTVLRIDLDDGAFGVVGREHRSIRRAQAHEPSANRGRRVTVPVSGLMRQTWPRESETQTASFPAVNAMGYPMGTLVVAVFVYGSTRRARSAVVTTQSASSPSATPTGTRPTSMIAEGSFVAGSIRSTW